MKTFIIILSLMMGFVIGSLSMKYDIEAKEQKMNLPEEYKTIEPSDNLIGFFDKDSVLHIEFDNSIQFEWEGLERDIPIDGDQFLNLSTNENIIYLNPVD